MADPAEDPAVCAEALPGTWVAACRACFLECDAVGMSAPDARGHLPCPEGLRVFAAAQHDVPGKRESRRVRRIKG